MAKTEAQKRANKKYDDKNIKYMTLCININTYNALEIAVADAVAGGSCKNRNDYINKIIIGDLIQKGLLDDNN